MLQMMNHHLYLVKLVRPPVPPSPTVTGYVPAPKLMLGKYATPPAPPPPVPLPGGAKPPAPPPATTKISKVLDPPPVIVKAPDAVNP